MEVNRAIFLPSPIQFGVLFASLLVASRAHVAVQMSRLGGLLAVATLDQDFLEPLVLLGSQHRNQVQRNVVASAEAPSDNLESTGASRLAGNDGHGVLAENLGGGDGGGSGVHDRDSNGFLSMSRDLTHLNSY